jgi:hypothetical protein
MAHYKLRELLGPPEEGNQQPSKEGDLPEGSTTSSNGVTDTMKDHERGAPFKTEDRVIEIARPNCVGIIYAVDKHNPEYYWVAFERVQVERRRLHYSKLRKVMR